MGGPAQRLVGQVTVAQELPHRVQRRRHRRRCEHRTGHALQRTDGIAQHRIGAPGHRRADVRCADGDDAAHVRTHARSLHRRTRSKSTGRMRHDHHALRRLQFTQAFHQPYHLLGLAGCAGRCIDRHHALRDRQSAGVVPCRQFRCRQSSVTGQRAD